LPSLELDTAVMQEPETGKQEFVLRAPTLDDAPLIHRLVKETGVLDVNSCYLYLLLCRDFSETCLIAERDSKLVGFVTAYRPPLRHDVLFVWQVAVCASARRCGLGLRMLTELLTRQGEASLKWIETTVSPSNRASRRLFDSLAAELEVSLIESEGFIESHFGAGNHESEPLLRIGPLPGSLT
jgi:L-2,4-diaminobutyric acid acetyltransferase